MKVYLDNSATTRCFDNVTRLMLQIMLEDYGNPSSMHHKGVEAEHYLRYARESLAKILKVDEKEIVFTSGGTESDNIAIIGTAMANHRAGRHLITTQIEHPAVLRTMKFLEDQGFRVTYLPVDGEGRISLEDLEKAMSRETILVSIMHTNNEIGTLQPIEEAGKLIKRINPRTLFHVDAVQGFGKFRIYPSRMNIDLLSVSAHKIHGPKGVGFLYINKQAKINPIMYGGGQQGGMRSGTENVPGIAGLAKAAEMMYANLNRDTDYLHSLKRMFINDISDIDGIKINGCKDGGGAPHIISLSVKGVRSEVLLHELEDNGIYVSAGSACSARKPQPSATLKAIGLDKELLGSTIRFSLSVFTTEEEIRYTLQVLHRIIPELRRYTMH